MTTIKMECEVKKWGNSMGIILPKNVVDELSLKPNDKINIDVVRRIKANEIYGLFPELKSDAQKVKDESRDAWG